MKRTNEEKSVLDEYDNYKILGNKTKRSEEKENLEDIQEINNKKKSNEEVNDDSKKLEYCKLYLGDKQNTTIEIFCEGNALEGLVYFVIWEENKKKETEQWLVSQKMNEHKYKYLYKPNGALNKKYIIHIYKKLDDSLTLVKDFSLHIKESLSETIILEQNELLDSTCFYSNINDKDLQQLELELKEKELEAHGIHLGFIENGLKIYLKGNDLKNRIHYVLWEENRKDETEKWLVSEYLKPNEYCKIYYPNGKYNKKYILHVYRENPPYGETPYILIREYEIQITFPIKLSKIIKYNTLVFNPKVFDKDLDPLELELKEKNLKNNRVHIGYTDDYIRLYLKGENLKNRIHYVFWEENRKEETEKWLIGENIKENEFCGFYKPNGNLEKNYILHVYKEDPPYGKIPYKLLRAYTIYIPYSIKNSKILRSEEIDEDCYINLNDDSLNQSELELKEKELNQNSIHLGFINNSIKIYLKGSELKYRIHYVLWEENRKEETEKWLVSTNIKENEYCAVYTPKGNKNKKYIFHVYKEFPAFGEYGKIPYKLIRYYSIDIKDPIINSKVIEGKKL